MMTESENITLTELQRVIRDRLYEALPGFYWVIAEIAELKVNNSGHCYIELTETDSAGGKITARARATIWAAKFRNISAFFISATGIPLRAGITILFKATVEYHELYGLSLNIADIDPSYTAGEMALKREAVIRQLRQEGILEMNRGLDMPLYPRNIAVVSSEKAAGYRDFVRHLQSNSYGYVFITRLFDAVMQGEETEESVVNALDKIASSKVLSDIVVIIRGGGSTTDLSWFDSYNIAFHVTQFPIPVLTGIGHEKDLSVADMVAYKALKTPTAVADYIIERTLETEAYVSEMASSISLSAEAIISDNKERLDSLQNHIINSSRMIIKVKQEKLGYFTDTLRRISKSILRNAASLAEKLDLSLHHLDPLKILERGFTMTSKDGKILSASNELTEGDEITTHFKNGLVTSIVRNIENK